MHCSFILCKLVFAGFCHAETAADDEYIQTIIASGQQSKMLSMVIATGCLPAAALGTLKKVTKMELELC